jgi:hypothetical protein
MNRLRIISIGLAIIIGMVALAPVQMIAFDGAEDEYLYIKKYFFANKSDSGKDTTTTTEAADGFDSAELEYRLIGKHKSNGNGEEQSEPSSRVTVPYVPVTGKENTPHPC